MNDMYVRDPAFQNMAPTGSAYAASRIISIVQTILPVRSVVHIGCARGTWLRDWYVRRDELLNLTPFAREFLLRDEEPVADTSPFVYRLCKRIVRSLAQPVCDRLARWNARRFPAG
jgi:hypothetical protein